MFGDILNISDTNLHITKYSDPNYSRYFLESCVYEVDDAIAIITYISYMLDKHEIPKSCRTWSAKEVDKTGMVKVRVEFERYF